jgi:probable phosphoglycerate mutase
MKLLLTRHGETEENKKGILQGWLPGHLSKEGKEQARLLGERLKDVKINYIYTSDLARCIETAKAIAKYHSKSKFVKDKFLRERGLGEFEGNKTGKSDWNALPGTLFTNKPKNGESFEEVWARLTKFYNKILKKHPDDAVLIVGHGGSMCLIEGIVRHMNLEKSMNLDKLKNTAISEFYIDKKGNCKVIYLNCEKHLNK